jgi:hypothetical protein
MVYIKNIVICIINFFFLQNHWFIIESIDCSTRNDNHVTLFQIFNLSRK